MVIIPWNWLFLLQKQGKIEADAPFILQDKKTIVMSGQKIGQGGFTLLSKDKIYDQFHNTPIFPAI